MDEAPLLAPAVPRRRLRVGVLFGGRSGEHDVSLQSARAVMAGLRRAGHQVVPIGITRAGHWLVGGDPLGALESGARGAERRAAMLPEPGRRSLVPLGEAADGTLVAQGGAQRLEADVDVVFPVLHGPFGEDGTVQGLLELAGLPYVGSGVLGSAVGMDKTFQKAYWRGLGLPIVDYLVVERPRWRSDPSAVLGEIEERLGYPCFTKPSNLGSSVGVHKARDRSSLEAALADSARYDERLVVERGIDARELECAVLGNDRPVASVVGEIIPHAEFYSYRAKYLDDTAEAVIPADLPEPIAQRIRALAVDAFRSIHGAGLARVDFFLERGTDRVYLNEVNTLPGFTRISMYPKLWEASGVPFAELVDRLVQLALERADERSANLTSYDGAGTD